ncbi:MAG TPA: hypothetical protein DD426_09965, partial [Clostridiaceae bacterium]|nr:hypothetical protein [Clostridiaceae bacterium]
YFYFFVFQNYRVKIGFFLSPDYTKLVEALIFVILFDLFYYKYNVNESIYLSISYILYLFIFVPSSIFYWMSEGARSYFYMQVISFAVLNMIYILVKQKNLFNTNELLKRFSIKTDDSAKPNKLAFMLLTIISIFFIVDIIIYSQYGHSLSYLFHLDKVYDIRYVTRETLPNKLFYLISWSTMAIVPVTIAWTIRIKKLYLAAIPIFIQILLFTIGGDKIYIFALMLSVFIYIIYRYKLMYYFVILLNYMIALLLIIKKGFILSLAISRIFFEPMSLSYSYYYFFSKYPKMYLSSSIFSRFIDNPYKLDSPFIISKYIYRVPKMSANVNFIANAYSNFGFLGIVVFTVILGIFLLIIENITYDKKMKALVMFTVFSSCYELENSALLTTLFYHGLMASIVMAYLLVLVYKKKKSQADYPLKQ